MALGALQSVMDRSIGSASPFAHSLFVQAHWDATEVQRFVNEVGNMTVATVNTGRIPHAAPVIAGYADGTLYFSVSPHSVLMRNLSAGSRIAFTVVGSGHNVLGQGSAKSRGNARDLGNLVPALGEQSRLSKLILEPWEGMIYDVAPSRLFAS